MQVARWGDDLVVRLPGNIVATLGLKEGDEVALEVGPGSNLTIVRDELAGHQGSSGAARDPSRMAAIASLRSRATPLPSGYKFDRDEANER